MPVKVGPPGFSAPALESTCGYPLHAHRVYGIVDGTSREDAPGNHKPSTPLARTIRRILINYPQRIVCSNRP